MSREVQYDAVRARVAEFGRLATLITVTEATTPHAVSVEVEPDETALLVAVGSSTLGNLTARPGVSLLWSAAPGGAYQLILDGTAVPTGAVRAGGLAEVRIDVSKGILHRLAGRHGTGPTCIALDDARV